MKHTKTQGLAFLIEDTFDKLAPVMAAQDIAEKLQGMLEDLGKIQPDDVMPLQDVLSKHYGADVATRFAQAVMDQVNQAIAAMQNAKMAIDGEIKRLETGADGGDMSDLAMDNAAPAGGPPTPPGAPETAPPEPGMPETPPGPEAAPGAPGAVPEPKPEPMGGSFAGRPRKEGAKPRGKLVREFLDTVAPPAHPYKSAHFEPNLEVLKGFHGGLGRLARNIEKMIDSGKLNGAEREGLTNALSSMAGVAHDAGHWVDPEGKLQSSLMANHLTNATEPEVALIVTELRKLAHGMALKHSQVMETSIAALRKSRNPDALVLKTFRTKLTEGRDAQLAAIRTARQYAIDVDDVVMIVREAAGNGVKIIRKIKEDFQQPGSVPPGVPIFPVAQAAPAVAAQPNTMSANPVDQGQPGFAANQSNSTRKPMTPAFKREVLTQQNTTNAQQMPSQPSQMAGQNPPPQNQQTPTGYVNQTDPNQKVTDPRKKKMMAGVGSSPQPNLR